MCGYTLKFFEKRPLIMIVIGVTGISLSSIFVKYSPAPSAVTAAWRLLWTVLLLSSVVLCTHEYRQEMITLSRSDMLLSCLSGFFLAAHFTLWFESLKHTSIASSTTIVCTEVIWVSLGFWLLLRGKLSRKAILAITVTLLGSALIAFTDASSEAHLYGDVLAQYFQLVSEILLPLPLSLHPNYASLWSLQLWQLSCFRRFRVSCKYLAAS